MDAEKELKKLKKEIETAKTEMAEANGQIKSILDNIRDLTGSKTAEAAEKCIAKWETEAKKAEEELTVLLKELKDDYGWD